MNYCLCDPFKRRGGDDCSSWYCLNECTGHGICKQGDCECDEDYYGLDCSVLIKSIISRAVNSLVLGSLVLLSLTAVILL